MAKRRKIFLTPMQEAELGAAYRQPRKGLVVYLAKKWGIGDSTLSYYARNHLKLPPLAPYRQRKEWSDLEIEILERYPNASDRVMAGHLRRLAGSRRSLMAIGVKRSRLDLLQASIEDQGFLSPQLIAVGLGLHIKTVRAWIETGQLPSKRHRGAHRGVSYEDLRDFLLHPLHARKWSVKKADQTFLLDVLRGPRSIPREAELAPSGRVGGGIRTHTIHQPEAAYV